MKNFCCKNPKIVICSAGENRKEEAVDFMTQITFVKLRTFGQTYREFGLCKNCGAVFEDSRYKK
jgi:hypothetical protein